MLMDYGWHDYAAWILALGTVAVFIALLIYDAWSDYKKGQRHD